MKMSRAAFLLLAVLVRTQAIAVEIPRRPITVADTIGMTRLVEPRFSPDVSDDERDANRLAHFSPDGKRFVFLLRKGDLKNDSNQFSLFLVETPAIFNSPKPRTLLTMASSSNRDAIRNVKWIDNDILAFIGEDPGEIPQVFTFDIKRRHLTRRTHSPTTVTGYDIRPDGSAILFVADPLPRKTQHEEVVIAGQALSEVLAGNDRDISPWHDSQLFLQQTGKLPSLIKIPAGDVIDPDCPLSFSPNGRHALIGASVQHLPAAWLDYDDIGLFERTIAKPGEVEPFSVNRYLLLDIQRRAISSLLDAPQLGFPLIVWSPTGESVYLRRAHLSLDATNDAERRLRRSGHFDVEVSLPSRKYRKVAENDLPVKPIHQAPIELALDQDPNTPPKLYITDRTSHQKALLFDLNPQFNELEFGRVETIEWEVSGAKLIAGLYLPPDYQPGKPYPLVIQTHGFMPGEFSMDGRSEWSSAFAARSLAAQGILVLQAQNFKDYEKDHDRVGDDRSLGATTKESFKNFNELLYEGAIDLLYKKGMIDRNRVGIAGFSRTVCFVTYVLTHSKYQFAAASLVDGVDGGYFQHILYSPFDPAGVRDSEDLNGGVPPFGEGINLWLKNSPSFSFDKVDTPVRLQANNRQGVLEQWEWYAALLLLNKPVDFVLIPDEGDGDNHLLVKPWERKIAQQGLVDWFRFWLKDEEDADSAKIGQYARWRVLRTHTIHK
jgi:dipeptidyl aminopeptidase/acylaminoacyl peptidase